MEFNLTRFFNYIKREWAMSWKTMLGCVSVPFLFTFAIMYKYRNVNVVDANGLKLMIIFYAAFIFAVIASNSFGKYKTVRKSIATILLPASTEEKWLWEFIYNYILLPFLIIFMAWAGMTLGELCFHHELLQSVAFWEQIKSLFAGDTLIYVYALISVLFFGSLFYKKLSIFKTAGSIIVVFIIYIFLQATYFNIMKPDMMLLNDKNPDALLEYGLGFAHYTKYLFPTLFGITAAVFTVLSYVKLKKEEQT
ncbi:MAG: hypothetical protein LBR28_07260 [Bacteroidales bacterium]|jgi:hypothetical protein|nr:hypothetical protein [Bacteroidales bacterium]